MLLDKENTCVILVDLQEKLTPKVQDAQRVISKCDWILRIAKECNIPILITEQYPKGLGSTLAPLNTAVPHEDVIAKIHFSCWKNEEFKKKLKHIGKKQCVLIGIETHVCILQTALDLKGAGFQVFTVVDAVSTRDPKDHKYGLKRMAANGVELITSEMAVFEWLERADTPLFKNVIQTYVKRSAE